ncbi:MAG: hypothetical protein VKK32_03650 [Candidatus Melainabacteria bacterium]|nr:hypothetical protein [Candidatus Melainabacteria bacterium]
MNFSVAFNGSSSTSSKVKQGDEERQVLITRHCCLIKITERS